MIHPELATFRRAEEDDAADFNMFETAALSLDAALDEILSNERSRLRSNIPEDAHHIIIAPSIPISSPLALDPGMTQLLLAYGYMTSFDQEKLYGSDVSWEEYRRSLWYTTNDIIQSRYLCWRWERQGSSIFEWVKSVGSGEYQYQPREALMIADWGLWLTKEAREDFVQPPHGPVKKLEIAQDFDWIVSNGLERIRILKRRIRDAVLRRVRQYGLDSIPDVHDLSSFYQGERRPLRLPTLAALVPRNQGDELAEQIPANNENTVVDWWRRFERHGINPDTGEPDGPGLFRNDRDSENWAARIALTDQGPSQITMTGFGLSRTRTTPWDDSFFWTGEPYALDGSSLVDVAPVEALEQTPLERDPDWVVVTLEGYLPADAKMIPQESEATQLAVRESVTVGKDFWIDLTKTPVPAGYRSTDTMEGYVFASPHENTVPLYTWYSQTRRDHMTSSDPRFMTTANGAPRATIPSDYESPKLLGYVYDPFLAQPVGTVPLWRWYSVSRKDFFTTSDPAWRFAI